MFADPWPDIIYRLLNSIFENFILKTSLLQPIKTSNSYQTYFGLTLLTLLTPEKYEKLLQSYFLVPAPANKNSSTRSELQSNPVQECRHCIPDCRQYLMGIEFKSLFSQKENFSIITIVFIKITASKKSHWPG